MASAFFAALRKAAVLPSETQVIDAFLSHLHEEVSARGSVEEVVDDAEAAVQMALSDRPNYEALRKTWAGVTKRLTGVTETAEAELTIQAILAERETAVGSFKSLGARVIKRNERILLYSQSQRVVQCLKGVPPALQKTIHLFVSECRPKSPGPYQDATATCQQLSDTYYSVTVCPDVVAGHLLATHQIDRLLMGAHAVFRSDGGEYHSFVNTCGSRLLTLAALKHGVRVDVIGETLKIEDVDEASANDHVHIHQENDLLESAVGLRDTGTRRGHISHLNIGYDLIPIEAGVYVHIPDEVKFP
jgi:translation initiation factor 2B subunit (eIF-2B alpha/beta/delta family)